MSRKELLKLLAGFRKFREKYLDPETASFRDLAAGQNPKSLIIACSDSRVDPAIITSAGPGDMFVVRNIGNLVPPYEKGGGFHGVSSAIEFAIIDLKVEHVIIMGHRQCGAIRALVSGPQGKRHTFVDRWVELAKPALENVRKENPGADEEILRQQCELEAIKTSIENLRTFPFVKEAEKRGMTIIGSYFDLEQGRLLELDESTGVFSNLNI